MRLINADELKETIFEKTDSLEDLWDTAGVLNAINNTKTVEPEITDEDIKQAIQEGYKTGYEAAKVKYERLQGEWNYIQPGMAVCPFCGATPHKDYKNFCANCGADMRGEKNESI